MTVLETKTTKGLARHHVKTLQENEPQETKRSESLNTVCFLGKRV